jgi:PAS domain S-box-containing protein
MVTPRADDVLIVAPYGKDAELLRQVLSGGGFESRVCRDVAALIDCLGDGAAAAIVADEALNATNIPLLANVLGRQPSWSDFPVLLLTGSGEVTEASRYRLNLIAPLGNVTLIERPIRTSTLLSAVATALRARRRQYEIRNQLERQRLLTETLRESEAKLKFALNAAQLGSWELRMPERVLEASPQFLRNFRRDPDGPFTYRQFLDAIHPEDREHVLQSMAEAFEAQSSFRAEYRITVPENETRWVWAAGRPIYDQDGLPSRMVGVTLDVTERRLSEEAVRASESQLRDLANSMPQMAWMANPDGYLFWYSDRWYEYTGTTFSDMEGWGWSSVHDPDLLSDVVSRWQKAIREGSEFEMEFPLRDASGRFRWFLTQSRPIFNSKGEVVRWFGTNTDIDDKKRAEKALRESEELARSVIQNSPDCVEVLDASGITLLVNASGCRVFGFEEGSVQRSKWTDAWPAKDREPASRALQAALAGRAVVFQDSRRTANGPERQWEISVTPIVDDQGNVSKILCISRDVTQRLRAEEELRQTAKLESLGIMAGGIAHDFNNLLTGILGNASLLAETADLSSMTLVEDIVAASQRAADLTRQMLAYSGRGRFEVRAIDLSSLVREILRLVRPMIHKDVSIELNLAEKLPSVEADPGQMQQLVMNLVINAAESMGGLPGRVTISSGVATEEDDVTGEIPPGHYVVLEVQDTGCGMTEETKSKIFDPFFTTKFTGRGLGLAAVSGIVRGHNGELRVKTAPGEGTSFKIFLPAREVKPGAAEQRPSTARWQDRGTVLLVDDEEFVRRVGRASLTRHGYDVLLAENGKEAVDLFTLHASDVSLVILDLTMPVMGGEEALGRLRQIRPDIPVVVCSGYNELEVAERFTSQSMAGFIQKPYTASALAQTVKSILENRYGLQGRSR